MMFKTLAAAAALAFAGVTTAAHATTLSVVGATNSVALDATFSLFGTPVYDANEGGVGGIGAVLSLFGADKAAGNGLSLSGPATLTFTYLGSEASFGNAALVLGGTLVTNSDAPGFVSAPFLVGAGFVPFSFASTDQFNGNLVTTIANDGGRDGDMRLAFSSVFNGGKSILAYLDDTDLTSIDYDDLVVRIDVSEIPLPAAAWLLISALGGMGLLARKRATA